MTVMVTTILLSKLKGQQLYYFNSDKICTTSVIAPDNQGALNFLC